jgi:hypothetical protein
MGTELTGNFYSEVSKWNKLFNNTNGSNFNTRTGKSDLRLRYLNSFGSPERYNKISQIAISNSRPTEIFNFIVKEVPDVSVYVFGPVPQDLVIRWIDNYYPCQELKVMTSVFCYKATDGNIIRTEKIHATLREPIGNEETGSYVEKLCKGLEGEVYGIGYKGEAFLDAIKEASGKVYYLGTSKAPERHKKSIYGSVISGDMGIEVCF